MLNTLIGLVLFLVAVLLLVKYVNKKYYILSLAKRVHTQDGSPLESKISVLKGKTIFGNNFDILQMTPAKVFQYVRDAYTKAEGKSYIWYFLFAPMYNVVRAEDADGILQSTKLITKNVVYELLRPFMGEGLLISTDQKWHFRRKMLTPAYHFSVLQEFLEIFKEESYKFINILHENVDGEVNLNDIIPQFTLNNICETALGVKLDDMEEGTRYREAIHALETIMIERACNPLLFLPIYFYIFGNYRKNVQNLKVAHNFSSSIIEKKRLQNKNNKKRNIDEYGRKLRYAMLDTLLEAESKGLIDHQGICDEVNTFMFEGYDTTSTCLIFTLLLLALHEDAQDYCMAELRRFSDKNYELSVFDYNKLVYLECVIKESLRLFPPVPFVGRLCTEECVVNGLILPKSTQISLHVFDIMRDPCHFSNPSLFNPDRFLLKNTLGRHPFSFIPFSAGQRNCIGQKFAILEIKVLLVSILKNFKLFPVTQLKDIIFEYGIVLRSQKNIKIKLSRRME